jgi:S1-C subfamily serine protease
MSRVCAGTAVGAALVLSLLAGAGPPPAGPSAAPGSRKATTADDQTFRPTVVLRCGRAQGSGTIIASVDGATLVLTAAHVLLEGQGTPEVELHRYNLGQETHGRYASNRGWPRKLAAERVAMDAAADLAVLRIGHRKRLPYVAQLAPQSAEPAPGTVVTSVGIDLGVHLSSWQARVVEIDRFVLEHQTEERPFVITTRPPEHGRSGGGLFLQSGALVGVCIGRAVATQQVRDGDRDHDRSRERVGIFAAPASIRRLLRENDLEETIARSQSAVRPVTTTGHATTGAPAPAPIPEVYLPKPGR